MPGQPKEIFDAPSLEWRGVFVCGTPPERTLDENETRVMGTFYSRTQIPPEEVH